MQIEPLDIAGSYRITPAVFPDPRGAFWEGFRTDKLAEVIGHRLTVEQTNVSVSKAGAVRGIHFADVPPGQAKYVTCVSGRLIDYVVDIRVGSPTFGSWQSVELDAAVGTAVYLAEGLGHCLYAVEDATALYLCSASYNPTREHGVSPVDPDIGLVFPPGPIPILSEKDTAAPSLNEAQRTGLLPRYDDCLEFYRSMGQPDGSV